MNNDYISYYKTIISSIEISHNSTADAVYKIVSTNLKIDRIRLRGGKKKKYIHNDTVSTLGSLRNFKQYYKKESNMKSKYFAFANTELSKA